MGIKPENKRLILSSKLAVDTMETIAGVKIEMDFYLSPILYSDSSSSYSAGQIVCVPKNRITKIPVENSWEYSCFETDVVYTKDSKTSSKDSNF